MCLFFSVVPATPNVVGADRLSRVTGLGISKIKGALHFSYGGKGCGCPLLAENADFSADYWNLEPEHLPRIESAFVILAREAHGFTLSAVWAGDEAESESTLSLEELLMALRANRVRNAHVYRVTGAA